MNLNPVGSAWRFKIPSIFPLFAAALLSALTLPPALIPQEAHAQFRSTYADKGGLRGGGGTQARPAGAPIRSGGAIVYPEFKSGYGVIRWIPQQMPLKVYVSRGLSLEGIIDEGLGAPVNNVNNINKWPDLLAEVVGNPEGMSGMPVAEGYTPQHFQACVEGINMWKAFEPEGFLSFRLTDDPSEADIYVFWVHHFVDKMGLALFSGDIRGYTAKRSFPYKAIMAGGQADFKPVLIQLRTVESNGIPMPYAKMRAAAAHEMGHALGIEGHSPYNTDLMSVYYGRGVLSANDVATIRYLYKMTPDLIP